MDDIFFSSKKDDWETPQKLFDKLDKRFHFDIDLAASDKNRKCEKYYTKKDDALSKEWSGTCWCNPPYGRNIKHWVKKASDSCSNGCATIVMLIPARTDTIWFHEYIYKNKNAKYIFVKGRIVFEVNGKPMHGKNSMRAPFPSMLVLFKKGVNNG